jgi:TolB-like protein/DNA-binding winged helix-turn-helix (wHTH) protein/Tfp pilus assembly protein PilF
MADDAPSLLRFDRFTLDLARGCLKCGVEEIPLRPKAYEVLRYLLDRPDRLVSKEELIGAIWPKVFVTDDALVHCVTELRQALGDRDQKIIRTIPRRGYRFVAPVAAIADATLIARIPELPASRRRTRIAAVLLLLLAVAGGVGGWWWHEGPWPPGAGEPSLSGQPVVAVLPFDDLGGDERQQRLASAFAEDLITELARSRDLLVIARNSSFAYRGKPVDARQIGQELGARYLLQGSFQIGPDRLRVTAQLIDAATGTHLWSERYDRPAASYFAVHDEVAGQIVGTLTGYSGPLAKAGMDAARRKRPESLRAYDYYLLAKAPYIRHDPAGMVEARRLLEKALQLDPGLVRAWEVLAWTHFRDAFNNWSSDRDASWQAFHDAARKAASLDPTDGGAHVVLGMSHFFRDEVEQGAVAWDRALALSPNDANVLRPVGSQLAKVLGLDRARQGLELAERAMRLDPLHPAIVASAVGFAAYFAGQYEKAVQAFKKKPNPLFDHHAFLAMSYAQLGRTEEARAEVEDVLRAKPDFSAEGHVDDDFFQPGGSSAALFFDGARKAGLPLCAPATRASRLDARNRLPECEAERAKLATPRRGPV